jgi:hypothetical protein
MSESAPNPFLPLLWFFIVTSIYFIIKQKTFNPDPNSSNSKIYGAVYMLLIIVGEFFINLNLTSIMCGSVQYDTAIIITLLPWLFIFGILTVVLSVFPGWLKPFSNTFGYGISKLVGLGKFFNTILKPKMDTSDISPGSTSESLGKAGEALEHIYSNPSLLINEISLARFDEFWSNMKSIFKPEMYNEKQELELYSYVRLKDNVAEYIWYILTGILVTSVSYNYVVNKGCKLSVGEMEKRRNTYQESLNKKATDVAPPKVYSTTE